MSLGKRIKSYREAKKLTQQQVADQLGLTVGGYAKMEREETEVSVKRIEELAHIFEVEVSDLLGLEGQPHTFNFNNNHIANGIVQNQQVNDPKVFESMINLFREDVRELRDLLKKAV